MMASWGKPVTGSRITARVRGTAFHKSKGRGPMTPTEMIEMLLATPEQQQETVEALQQRLESLEAEVKRLR